MITGVIETFAICRLYRLHWRWFSLQGYLALPLFVYQSSVRFDIKQFGALAVFHEKWSKRRFQHNAANARLRTECGLRSRFQGISLPCSAFITLQWLGLAHVHVSATSHSKGDAAKPDRKVIYQQIGFTSFTHLHPLFKNRWFSHLYGLMRRSSSTRNDKQK